MAWNTQHWRRAPADRHLARHTRLTRDRQVRHSTNHFYPQPQCFAFFYYLLSYFPIHFLSSRLSYLLYGYLSASKNFSAIKSMAADFSESVTKQVVQLRERINSASSAPISFVFFKYINCPFHYLSVLIFLVHSLNVLSIFA